MLVFLVQHGMILLKQNTFRLMKSVLLLANPSLRVANRLFRVSLTDAPPKYWNVLKEPASQSMKTDVNCASAQVRNFVCKFKYFQI